MEWKKLVVNRRFSLDLSLYPSFNLALSVKTVSDAWMIVAGRMRGVVFRQQEGNTIYYRNACEEEIRYLTGVWFDPVEKASTLPRSARARIWPLIEEYKYLGLSINPYDKEWVFTAVFLSRNTDYHINTIRWCRALAEKTREPRMISEETVKRAGSSYQLKQLPQALKEYYRLVEPLESRGENMFVIRKAVLSIRNCGLKTAHAYLLFTRPQASSIVPCDTHFLNIARRLGFVDDYQLWNEKYCAKYDCSNCPLQNKCIIGKTIKEYGELAGWIQTACYTHDKLYCMRRKCEQCRLKEICISQTH